MFEDILLIVLAVGETFVPFYPRWGKQMGNPAACADRREGMAKLWPSLCGLEYTRLEERISARGCPHQIGLGHMRDVFSWLLIDRERAISTAAGAIPRPWAWATEAERVSDSRQSSAMVFASAPVSRFRLCLSLDVILELEDEISPLLPKWLFVSVVSVFLYLFFVFRFHSNRQPS